MDQSRLGTSSISPSSSSSVAAASFESTQGASPLLGADVSLEMLFGSYRRSSNPPPPPPLLDPLPRAAAAVPLPPSEPSKTSQSSSNHHDSASAISSFLQEPPPDEDEDPSYEMPRPPSGGDLAAVIAQMSLQFASLNERLERMAGQIGRLDSRVGQLVNVVDELKTNWTPQMHPPPRRQTPPPPPYVEASALPPPPPSFFSPHPQSTPWPGAPPGTSQQGAAHALYFGERGPPPSSSHAPPVSTAASGGPTKTPTSVNTSVCSHCYLYFSPFDLRAHQTLCRVKGAPPSQAPVPPRSVNAPVASAPPPPATIRSGEGGRVVIHKGKYYWIPEEGS